MGGAVGGVLGGVGMAGSAREESEQRWGQASGNLSKSGLCLLGAEGSSRNGGRELWAGSGWGGNGGRCQGRVGAVGGGRAGAPS